MTLGADSRWIADIGDAAERIRSLCDGSFSSPPRDDQGGDGTIRREAMKFNLIVIGEAAGRLSPSAKDLAPEIPWSRVRGLRNVITHEDHRRDDDDLDHAVTDHLPTLVDACHRMRSSTRFSI